jgi:hypothetical protein
MNLIRAELDRLLHRRFMHIMLAVIVGVLGLVAFSFAATSEPPSQYELDFAASQAATAQAEYDRERNACLDVARGVTPAVPNRFPLRPNCNYGPRPTVNDFLNFEFVLVQEFEPLIYLAAVVLSLFAFLVSASFVGAEWTSGGLINLLLWRPQRVAVLGAKLGVALAVTLTVSVLFLAVWIGTFMLVGYTRGAVGAATPGQLMSFGLLLVRVVVLALAVAAAGFALASLGRHTAMALGGLIAYLLVYELGITIVFQILGETWPWRLRLLTYAAAWLFKDITVNDGYTCGPDGCFQIAQNTITWQDAGVIGGGLVIALVAAAFLALRRRDIT